MLINTIADFCRTYSGIYIILNNLNNKFYVGSASKSFDQRWRIHVNSLKSGTHHSTHLQRAWNKYGEENFEFLVLEQFINPPSKELIITLEQFWIDTLKPAYNCCPKAANSLGYKFTDEQKEKMRIQNTGRKWTEDQRVKILQARQSYTMSEDTKAKIGYANAKKEFIIITPQKEVREVNNLSEYARLVGLRQGDFSSILSGRQKQTFGYKILYKETWITFTEDEKNNFINESSKRGKQWLITHPNLVVEIITSLREFCALHNLSYSYVLEVLRKGQSYYKGYHFKRSSNKTN